MLKKVSLSFFMLDLYVLMIIKKIVLQSSLYVLKFINWPCIIIKFFHILYVYIL